MSNNTTESKIRNFDDSFVADEYILGFEVSMEHFLWVHILNSS